MITGASFRTAVAALGLLFLAETAWGSESIEGGDQAGRPDAHEPERVRLTYEAVEGCPSEAVFSAEIRARIRRPVTFTDEASARQIRVRIPERGERVQGELEIVEPDGQRSTRAIAAATCDEVASGLALVVALALDPNANTDPLTPAERDPEPVPPPAAPADDAAETPRSVRRLVPFIGLNGGLGAGHGPVARGAAGVLLGARYETGSIVSPALYLAPSWAKTGVTGPAYDRAVFSWTTLRADACPLRLPARSAFALLPCAAAETGQVSAKGDAGSVDFPMEKSRFFGAVGPSLRGHAGFGSWFVELGAGALFSLVRDEFVFEQPRISIHQPWLAVFEASLALGVDI